MKDQNKAVLFDTLYEYSKTKTTSFDVPGHKQGLYTNKINSLLDSAIAMDVNSMQELDLLQKPVSIIKEAQQTMAELYNFDNCFFLVNGTTAGILAMIYASVKENEKIAVPRNVHKSVINAIILSGAIPIFIEPNIDKNYMIMNQITHDDIVKTYNEHKDLKALLIINPTYFGVVAQVDEIVNFCKKNNIISLIDQAHGAHFNFYDDYKYKSKPDIVAMSTHKTLGSLSQSSILLHNNNLVSKNKLATSLSMFQSTSASYLLMASLDETRRDIYTNKLDYFEKVKQLVIKAREEINKIDGLSCIDDTYNNGEYKIDPLKLTIKVNELGISGFEMYTMLKEKYNIQMELAECYTVLAIISIADNKDTIFKLVDALKDISKTYYNKKEKLTIEFGNHHKLKTKMSPYKAFSSEKEEVKINDALNKISANTIMIYPPGIPICLPGEVIDKDVISLINFYNKNTIFTISDSKEGLLEIVKE